MSLVEKTTTLEHPPGKCAVTNTSVEVGEEVADCGWFLHTDERLYVSRQGAQEIQKALGLGDQHELEQARERIAELERELEDARATGAHLTEQLDAATDEHLAPLLDRFITNRRNSEAYINRVNARNVEVRKASDDARKTASAEADRARAKHITDLETRTREQEIRAAKKVVEEHPPASGSQEIDEQQPVEAGTGSEANKARQAEAPANREVPEDRILAETPSQDDRKDDIAEDAGHEPTPTTEPLTAEQIDALDYDELKAAAKEAGITVKGNASKAHLREQLKAVHTS